MTFTLGIENRHKFRNYSLKSENIAVLSIPDDKEARGEKQTHPELQTGGSGITDGKSY